MSVKLLNILSACCMALLLLVPQSAFAEKTSESKLKAAFTLNYARFSHWPAHKESSDGRLQVCIEGRSPVTREIRQLKNKKIGRVTVQVKQIKIPGSIDDCQILFISNLDPIQERHLLVAILGLPVITISDTTGFAEAGGMIELALNNRRVEFYVNLESIRKSGISIDPKVLKLAQKVYGRMRE